MNHYKFESLRKEFNENKGVSKKERLILEAKKRGLVKGVKVVHLTDESHRIIASDNYIYYPNSDSLYSVVGPIESIRIYHQGKWSEVVGDDYSWVKQVKVGDKLICKSGFCNQYEDLSDFNNKYGGAGYRDGLEFTVSSVGLSRTKPDNLSCAVIWTKESGGILAKAIIPPIEKPRINITNSDAADAMSYVIKSFINKNQKNGNQKRGKREIVGKSIKVQRESIGLSRGKRPSGTKLEAGRPTRTVRGKHKGNKSSLF